MKYNTESFKKFKECAKYAFEAQEIDRDNVAAKVFKLGEIGPNGLVRIHVRKHASFTTSSRRVKDKIAAMLATADDAVFNTTESGGEIIITVGITGIIDDWKQPDTDEAPPPHFYAKLEDIV